MGRSRARSKCQSAVKQTWMTCGWHEAQTKQTWQDKDQTWAWAMQRAWSETHEINTGRVLTLSQCPLLRFTSTISLIRRIQILYRSTDMPNKTPLVWRFPTTPTSRGTPWGCPHPHSPTPHGTPWVRHSTPTSHGTPWDCPVSTLRSPRHFMDAARFPHCTLHRTPWKLPGFYTTSPYQFSVPVLSTPKHHGTPWMLTRLRTTLSMVLHAW